MTNRPTQMRPEIKICGLTCARDAQCAAEAGADYLGFIFYSKSPRAVTLETFREMRGSLPDRPRVYVQVAPDADELRRAREEGFAHFQIHFPADEPEERLAAWAGAVERENLWLAPKSPPGAPFREELLAWAGTLLVDTYTAHGFGGSGETGDWDRFRRLEEAYPETKWVLAGGLTPENVGEAVRVSGARMIDVGSGVESSPGRKDPEKLRKLFAGVT